LKKLLLFIFLVVTLLINNKLFAQTTYTWIGGTSQWNTTANWSHSGGTGTTFPGSQANDIAVIGAVGAFPTISALSGSISMASITLGTSNTTTAQISVASTFSLTLSGDIIFVPGASANTTVTLAGAGTISATNLNITASTIATTYTLTLNSSITALNLSGNIALTSLHGGVHNAFVICNLAAGGTTSVTGTITTTNSNNNNSRSTLSVASGATLNLANATALSGLSALGTNVITFNNGSSTIGYTGSSQTVYTSAAITGLAGGVSYDNLVLSGSGTKTIGATTVVGAAFTNGSGVTANLTTGNFSVGTTTDNSGTITNTSTGAVTFTGIVTNQPAGIINQSATSGTMTFSVNPANTGNINLTAAGAITFSNPLTNAGTITKTGTGTLTLNGATTNSGTIMQSATNLLSFPSTVTNTGTITASATGTGGITFNAAVNNTGGIINQSATSGTMTFPTGQTNAGTINHTAAGALVFSGTLNNTGTINQTGTGAMSSGALTNSNIILATSTGSYTVTTITNNSPGAITFGGGANGISGATVANASGATITLAGTTTIGAATAVTNDGTFNAGTGSATFTVAFTNSATGTLNFSTGTTTFTAAFTNSGILNQTGAGTVTFNNTFTNAKTVSLTGVGGTMAFNNTSASAFTNNVAPAVFTASAGSVTFSPAGVQTLTNNNTSTAVTFNNVTFAGAFTKTLTGAVGSAGFATSGIVTMTTTTILSVSANTPFTNNGTFNGGSTGTVTFGTTFTNGSSAAFNSSTGATTTFSGAVTNSGGTITQSSTALMSFGNTVNNSGTITDAATGTGGITFSNTVTNQPAGIINQSATSGTMTFTVTPANTGNINLTTTGNITFNAALTNAGNITRTGTGSLTLFVGSNTVNSGTITQGATGLLTFPALLNNTGTVTASATGTGGITFTGQVTNGSTGIINQSATSGTMTFSVNPANTGNINLTAAGAITFTLALTNAGNITKNGAGALNLTGATGNSGVITQGSSSLLTFPGTLNNTGTVTASSTGTGGITFTGVVTNTSPGIINVDAGTATFSATFANSGAVTQSGGTIAFPLVSASAFTNNATPATFIATGGSVTFSGAGNQTITNLNTTTPVTFNNLNISTSGTKNLVGLGLFAIASSGVITLSNTSATTVFDPGTALLTLTSTATGSASIATLPANTSIIATATVTVQRFLTGAAINYRGYRLLSSAINSSGAYTLTYLSSTGSANTGSGGVGGGFTSVGNPSIYLYREDKVPSNASFSAGNYRAITAISPSLTTIDGAATLYSGNGFLYFYRGNPGTNPATVPSSLVFSVLGNLNLGAITVKPWFTGLSTLSYSLTSGTTAVEGFNLVGNPYPSSINWDTYSTTTPTAGIYAPNVGNTIYTLNPSNKGYASYVAGTGGNGASTNGGSNYIASGQGFFVVASTGSSSSLTFNETAKISGQPATLLLNSSATPINPHLRLKLVKDSINNDDIYVGFRANATTKYVFNEDALYKVGSNVVSLSSMSGDRQALAINFQPFPKTTQIIPLNVGVPAAGGLYQLNLSEANDIPAIYDVWLMDKFKNDSLDIKHNPTYSFNTTSDTATYGANRFKLVIRLNTALSVHLLSFTGVKDTKQIKLTWTTENEGNYTTYVLQRSTDGGHTFTTLDSLTSANLGTYNDLDPNPVTGINLYRLKQVDVTGSVSYSSVLSFTYTPPIPIFDKNNAVNVYPNPVKYILGVVIKPKGDKPANYKITITNNMGMIIKTATTTLPIWLDSVVNLLPGTYFVNVTNSKDNSFVGRATFIKL
jgi:hypothetical protein